MRSVTLWLILASLSLVACKGCKNSNNSVDTGNDTRDSGLVKICEPGEIVQCNEENTPSIQLCNGDGTATVPGSCPNDSPRVCRNGDCVEVDCIPGNRRCLDDEQREECNQEGTGWDALPDCEGVAMCSAGECLDRCGLAELTNSYIGCEYWAAELDNALLNEDGLLSRDETPPYAIVLANTSLNYDAVISVYSDEGVVALADAERLVGTDIQFPGEQLVTVRSELVDQNGVQLLPISGPIENLPLPRQSIMTLILPPRAIPFQESTVTKVGYRVESSEPIVAYQFNPLCCNYNFTNDASLLLPTSALTENYMFMGYEVWTPQGGATSYSATLSVIGTEPDTQVTVTLRPSRKGRSFSEILYPNTGQRITGPNDSGVITATIGPHEVLNLGAMGIEEDITGARISATKPVAVFGGHTCAFVPDGNAACDHLESQLFPLETWGRRFIAAPLKIRGVAGQAQTLEGTYFKFLALEDGTTVQTGINIDYSVNRDVLRQTSGAVRPCRDFAADPSTGEFTLDAGESCALGSKVMFVAESGKPLSVGAFLSGQGSVEENPQFGDHNGDPAFFLVPPEEQFRSEYSFLTPATYFVSYVTVIIRPGFNVFLDGVELDPTTFDYEVVESAGLARAHIPVEPGPHFITSANQIPFGIVVYGYDDYVSYAYTGGLDLTKLNEL